MRKISRNKAALGTFLMLPLVGLGIHVWVQVKALSSAESLQQVKYASVVAPAEVQPSSAPVAKTDAGFEVLTFNLRPPINAPLQAFATLAVHTSDVDDEEPSHVSPNSKVESLPTVTVTAPKKVPVKKVTVPVAAPAAKTWKELSYKQKYARAEFFTGRLCPGLERPGWVTDAMVYTWLWTFNNESELQKDIVSQCKKAREVVQNNPQY